MFKCAGKCGSFLANSRNDAKKLVWKKTIKDALSFSIKPKRFLPFFALDLVLMLLMISLIGSNADIMTLLAYGDATVAEGTEEVLMTWYGIFMAWVITSLAVTGALIHQSVRPKEFKKSWLVGLRCLPNLFLALLLVSLISIAISMVPYLGALLTIVIGLMFLFVNQLIVLDGVTFYRSLTSSTRIFTSKSGAAFFTWFFATLVSLLIAGAFMLPLFGVVTYDVMLYGVDNVSETLLSGSEGIHIQLAFAIALLGMSITKVFSLNFQTGIYTQLKKKKWIVF